MTNIEAENNVDIMDEIVEEQEVEATDSVEAVDEIDDSKPWYIIQCFTGQEYKVRDRVEQLVEEKEASDRIVRVLVPEEETVEIKNNKRLEKVIKIFPGYVFVQMDYDDQLGFEIRRLPGVAKFVGSKVGPTPVSEEEILRVLRKVGDKTRKIDIDYEIDEVVKVIAGPFRGYTGPIAEINPERGKLKALISIFGRETPVELEFDQVEKTI